MSTAATASGTLTMNTHRHENVSISQPPTNGPTALEIPARPDQAPMARPRSSSWNAEPMIARLPGTRSAPAAPCTARDAASTVASGRGRARDARHRERHEAGQEDTPAAEAVAERAAEQEQRRERDEIRVDRPLQARHVGVEVAARSPAARR